MLRVFGGTCTDSGREEDVFDVAEEQRSSKSSVGLRMLVWNGLDWYTTLIAALSAIRIVLSRSSTWQSQLMVWLSVCLQARWVLQVRWEKHIVKNIIIF